MTGLASFPNELIEQILHALCVNHFQNDSFRGFGCLDDIQPPKFQDQISGLAALASLCRVSKYFRDLATWRLYHTLIPGSRVIPKWWLLTHTLITQPHLAALVHHLILDDIAILPGLPVLPWEVTTHFIERATLASPDATPFTESLADHSSESHTATATALMSSLCPSLETLRCVVHSSNINLALCTPASLPALRALGVCHWDTAYSFSIDDALPLLRAAPNLTHLRFVQPSGSAPESVRLQHVVMLELRSACIEEAELTSILRMCPNVERLHYECGGPLFGDKQFGPEEAVEALREHAPWVREFELDLVQWDDLVEFTVEDMQAARAVLSEAGVVCRFAMFDPTLGKPVYFGHGDAEHENGDEQEWIAR
jgi:hypothetical protein